MAKITVKAKLVTFLQTDLFVYLFIGVLYGVLAYVLRDTLPFTPDFTKTDVFHPNVSYKYYLWKSIRLGVFPFWTDLLNGGFPLIAEGQFGLLYLPYYLIFPLFSNFSHAYNVFFVFHLLLLTIGMYILLRYFHTTRLLAFLLSVTFAWNGSISFRWVHLIVLQSFAFVPLLYWSYLKWNDSQSGWYAILTSLIICEMIFAGFIQVVFIALVGLLLLYLYQNFPLKRHKTLVFLGSLILGILLALPQVLPTLQLTGYTSRTITNSYDFAVSVPFNMENLCSFYSATCLGTPQNGSYSFNWQKDGIYWENTPYVGELFIFILLISGIAYVRSKRKAQEVLLYFILFIVFTLLALGKNSPLYFIFSIFPFSIFRTPPRFLLFAVLFLIVLSSFTLKQLMKSNPLVSFITYFILFVNCLVLIAAPFSYHVFLPSSTLLGSVRGYDELSSSSYYYTYGSEEEWNAIYKKQGWSTKRSIRDYLFINKALLPNTSLISGKPQFDIYASLDMRRQLYIKTLIKDGLDLATDKDILSSNSAQLETIFKLYNITTLLSFKPLYLPHFPLIKKRTQGNHTINIYSSNSNEHTLFYIPKEIQLITHVEDITNKIINNELTQNKSVAESFPMPLFKNTAQVRDTSSTISPQYIKSSIISDKEVYVVLKQNWYPDWKLFIDGKEHRIFKTNLIHMGFFVPQGNHVIEFRYIPAYFYFGLFISIGTIIAGVFIIIFQRLKSIQRSEK